MSETEHISSENDSLPRRIRPRTFVVDATSEELVSLFYEYVSRQPVEWTHFAKLTLYGYRLFAWSFVLGLFAAVLLGIALHGFGVVSLTSTERVLVFVMTAFFAGACGACALTTVVMLRSRWSRNVRAEVLGYVIAIERCTGKGPFTVTVDPEIISISGAESSGTSRWSTLQDVFETPRGAFVLAGNVFAVIPKRCFESAEDLESFLQEVRSVVHTEPNCPLKTTLEHVRTKGVVCVRCKYNLKGLPHTQCPECGMVLTTLVGANTDDLIDRMSALPEMPSNKNGSPL